MGGAEGEQLGFVNEAFETNWLSSVGPNIDAFERELGQLESLGLLIRTPVRAWLSGRGVSVADAIAREFM